MNAWKHHSTDARHIRDRKEFEPCIVQVKRERNRKPSLHAAEIMWSFPEGSDPRKAPKIDISSRNSNKFESKKNISGMLCYQRCY